MTVARPSPPRADRPGTLLDWRFLLPDARLERVAVVGKPPAARGPMLEALARDAAQVSDGSGGTELDGAVVFGLDADGLRRARAAVAPGGWVYVEGDAWRRTRRPAAIREALERAGWVGVRVHWHWPSFTATDEIVPLESSAALADAFTRRRRSGLRGLVYRALAALARTPLLPALATDVSAVATAEVPRPSGIASAVDEHLAPRDDGRASSGADPVISYLTPRYGTSRNVVALARSGGQRGVAAVAKLPRDGRMDALQREADALRLLERRAPSLAHVPRVLALADDPGRQWLLETAVAGRIVDRADLVGDREGWIGRIEAWTDALASVTDGSNGTLSIGEAISEALATLARYAGTDPAMERPVERARGLLAPLGSLEASLALEHGDLAPPNLLITHRGELGVVDWELAGLSHVPLHDLAFFLTHLAWELETGSRSSRLRSIRESLLEPEGWGARALARASERLGLEPDVAQLVLLASWTRTAARTVDRVAWAEPLDADAGTDRIRRVRELRALAIWQRGVEHLDREVAA